MERFHGKFQNSSILCKNECGFYGNPSWNNYCSRCHREEYMKNNLRRQTFPDISPNAFSKFEAKRKKVAGKSSSTVKNILATSKDQNNVISNLPEEAAQARLDFNKVLDTWKSAARTDVSKQVAKLLQSLDSLKQTDIDSFSISVQNFYTSISSRIYNHQFYSTASTDQKEELINAIERFVTVWIYPWAFAPNTTDDEEVDLKLQDKIRSLHWVSHIPLAAPINPTSPDESRHLESAALALISINSVMPTEAKLDQIVLCCRNIFEALNLSSPNAAVITTTSASADVPNKAESSPRAFTAASNPPANYNNRVANADDFLPTLIWIVLRASPPLLHSNLQFIMRFANQTRLNTGQAAYFFTNLCCAVDFIKSLSHESLDMTEEEFTTQMRDGVSVTLCPVDIPDVLSESERRYTAISEKISEIDDEIFRSEHEFKSAFEDLTKRIGTLRNSYPLQRTVYLDPRELTSPDILFLGPPEKPTVPPITGQKNLLDELDVDDLQTPCLVPSSTT